ncbi:transposase [Paenibacillus popilliae]|uniref:Transposase and inactivated derivative n=1 Tax=Paenibacillus popilliae ATCC 14706 TaxID=1212764 RepID=M9L7I1_PAEPP|nr:transposase [Paenibacillus popilliae]GAC40912.1 transposase and inactivated derivative [Paenibacillus popilliae ATCC 14706]
MKKPLYDETYKRKTVQYVKESGKAVAEVARELKIKDNTLYGWMKKYGGEPEIIAAQVFKSEDHPQAPQQGVTISERTVTRIMRKHQWRSRTVKKV